MELLSYLKRVLIMILIVLPCTAFALAFREALTKSASGKTFTEVLGGAFFLVYVWGAITGSLLSVSHTFATRALTHLSIPQSLTISIVIGLVAGAATPTAFTGFLNINAVILGGLTGLMYGAVVWLFFRN